MSRQGSCYKPCELCHERKLIPSDETICITCDAAMEEEQCARDAARKPPQRFCRQCKVKLPLHKYFKCDRCDQNIHLLLGAVHDGYVTI